MMKGKPKNKIKLPIKDKRFTSLTHNIGYISHPIMRVVTQTYGYIIAGKTMFISFISKP